MEIIDQKLHRIVDGLQDECDFRRVVMEPDEITLEEQAVIGEVPLTDSGDPVEVFCKSARLN